MTLIQLFYLGLCTFTLSEAAARKGVIIRGTTMPPSFVIKEGSSLAPECPGEYPYIFNNKSHCCSSRWKKNDTSIHQACDGSFLSQTDPLDCCFNDDHVSCLLPPCKTHWKGFLKNVTRYICQDKSINFYDYSLDLHKSPDYPISSMTSPTHGQYFHGEWISYKHGAIMCGGGGIVTTTSPSSSQECSFYDPIQNRWDENFPDFQEGHFRGCLVLVGNVMFAFGGRSPGGNTLTTEFFNEATNAWEYSPPDYLPTDPYGSDGPTYMVATAYSDDEVYFFGGQVSGAIISNVVYHKIGGAWTKRTTMARPNVNMGIGVINFRGKRQILLAGGRKGLTSYKDVEVYDPETNSWTRDAAFELPSPRFFYQYESHVINGKLHLFGGHSSAETLLNVLVFEGETASPMWRQLPRPLPADCTNGAVITTQEPRRWLLNNGP